MHVPVQALSQQTPSTQKPEAQGAEALHACPFLVLHPPAASQACPSEQLPATSSPAVARTQVPSDPGTAQDLQGPLQLADSQHIPSTQKPDRHLAAVASLQPSPLPQPVTVYSQVSLKLAW
jgi:hypothetical protein